MDLQIFISIFSNDSALKYLKEIKDRKKLKEALEKQVEELTMEEPDLSLDDLNGMLDEINPSYLNNNGIGPAENLTEYEKAKRYYNIPKLNLTDEQLQKRREVRKSASELQKDVIVDEIINLKFKDNKLGTKNIKSRHTLQFIQNFTNGSGSDFEKLSMEDKQQRFEKALNSCYTAIYVFSKKMTDEEFVQNFKKYYKEILFLGEFQKDNLETLAAELGVTIPDNIKNINANYKINEVAVSISGQARTKLSLMSNPYYEIMELESMKIVNDRLMFSQNEDVMKKFKIPSSKLALVDVKPNEPKISAFNDFCSAVFGFVNSISAEVDKAEKTIPKDTVQNNLKINTLLIAKKNGLKTDLKYYDLETNQVIEDGNEQELLINGKTLGVFVGDKMIEIKLNRKDFTTFDITESIQKKTTMTMSKGQLAREVKQFTSRLSDVNRFLFKPTQEFTNFADRLNQLSKLDPYKEKDKDNYAKILQECCDFARDYLKNKEISAKPKTKKTNDRINFAKEFLDNFDHAYANEKIAKENGVELPHFIEDDLHKNYVNDRKLVTDYKIAKGGINGISDGTNMLKTYAYLAELTEQRKPANKKEKAFKNDMIKTLKEMEQDLKNLKYTDEDITKAREEANNPPKEKPLFINKPKKSNVDLKKEEEKIEQKVKSDIQGNKQIKIEKNTNADKNNIKTKDVDEVIQVNQI